MSVKQIFTLILIGIFLISAIAVPGKAEISENHSVTIGVSFENTKNPVSINISESDRINLTANNEYDNYMRSFSSNILLLLFLLLSGSILLLLNISGRRYSKAYYYIEKFYLRVILIPAYCVMGILLILISLFSIALIGGSIDTSADTLMSVFLSFIFFMYAMASLWLAYSIVTKKVYIFILAFEISLPALILLFSIAEPQNYESLFDIAVNLTFFLIIIAIPVMHTQMLKKRKTSTTINYVPNINSAKDENTLMLNEEKEAIEIHTLKTKQLPPDLSERYMNSEYIGKGGTAKIFRAKKRNDGETVAVKVPISFDERTGRNFLKEINIWKELSHKNIVKIYSVNILPVPYVEMEYFRHTLADLKKPASLILSKSLIKGIAEGLSYAHKKGILHRDIKPQNILLAEDCTPKITDWGLGKLISDVSETRTIAFSLNYASPEQVAPGIFGHSNKRTDIFQLGVVFYEILTGDMPFSGEGIGEFSGAIINSDPEPPSSKNPDAQKYDKIIMKCLEKYPDNRYQNIEEFITDLDRID